MGCRAHRALQFSIVIAVLSAPSFAVSATPDAAGAKAVVAVVPMTATGSGLGRNHLGVLTSALESDILESGLYVVIPGLAIEAAILKTKKDSFKASRDASLRVELGKEVSAQEVVSGEIRKVGEVCEVAIKSYDLQRGAATRASTARGPCKIEELRRSVRLAAYRLAGILPPAGSTKELFTPQAVPLAALEKPQPAEIPPLDSSVVAEFNVDELEAYEQAVDLETETSVSATDRVHAWQRLAKVSKRFDELARTRIALWNEYAEAEQAAEAARREVEERRGSDWEKLSRLFQLRVVPEAKKEDLAVAFVETYGGPGTNPFFADPMLNDYLARAKWPQVIKQLDATDDVQEKTRLLFEFISLHPSYSPAQEHARNELGRACGAESGAACNYLGLAFAAGIGVLRDDAKAREYYRRACTLKSAFGCSNLGFMLFNGLGGAKDDPKAVRYYELACQMDIGLACNDLGFIRSSTDLEKAQRLYTKACALHHPMGCVNLASLLASGRAGVKDPEEAGRKYLRACELGLAEGCASFGFALEAGLGTRKNEARAREFYSKACEMDHQPSCVTLARMHQDGRGGPRNDARAHELFETACNKGVAIGCGGLALVYEQGISVRKDATRARALLERSCELSVDLSCRRLAAYLDDGFGGPKDAERAAELRRKLQRAELERLLAAAKSVRGPLTRELRKQTHNGPLYQWPAIDLSEMCALKFLDATGVRRTVRLARSKPRVRKFPDGYRVELWHTKFLRVDDEEAAVRIALLLQPVLDYCDAIDQAARSMRNEPR